MTLCWIECPTCGEETNMDWDTFSFAGEFRSFAKCGHCGEKVMIHVNVSAAQHSVQPTGGDVQIIRRKTLADLFPAIWDSGKPPTSG